jgi:hypothetical protein
MKKYSLKPFCLLIIVMLAACKGADKKTDTLVTEVVVDTELVEMPEPPAPPPPVVYKNARFKDVMVRKTAGHIYLITGKAQLFEAALSWVVEDGHEEIKKGFATADAGGPAWGAFRFTVDVIKKRPNSTLHLILFEASAKDGSRQHELPVLLY